MVPASLYVRLAGVCDRLPSYCSARFVLVRQTNAARGRRRGPGQTNTRFDTAINNMSQGLCLFDADKQLVISNSRYRRCTICRKNWSGRARR